MSGTDTMLVEGQAQPRRRLLTIVSLAISITLLTVLYRRVDIRLVGGVLASADVPWLVASVSVIAPITLLRALRFYWVAPPGSLGSGLAALRLTLVSSAFNLVLPAKSGDLAKSVAVARGGATTAGVSVAIVVYERLCDLFGLIAWCVLGWVLERPEVNGLGTWFWLLLAAIGTVAGVLLLSPRAAGWVRAAAWWVFRHRRVHRVRDLADGWPALLALLKSRRRWILAYSLGLWFTHLLQIWMFTIALGADIPWSVSASLSAVALMAGQIPLTVAGLGTRDVALVVLLAEYMAPESAAALGVLLASRTVLPALAGLPLVAPYLRSTIRRRRATAPEAAATREA